MYFNSVISVLQTIANPVVSFMNKRAMNMHIRRRRAWAAQPPYIQKVTDINPL